MDLDKAIARYFANEEVGKWLLNGSPVREVTVEGLKKSFVYSIGMGKNAVGDGPHELDIEDMLIVCGTPGHFVVGVIWGLGQPHCFSQTPIMSNAVPICRRFAVDLSRRDCLEFMEFVIFEDKKVVVFLRHFLHTPDYTLPVIATSRLYASYGPGLSLGRIVMKAVMCEKANCPNCKLPSETCKCVFQIEKHRSSLQLTTHSWVQYASSFIRKARRGWTRFSLSAHIPHVGDTMLVESFFPSLTVVQFGDSEYMRLMQRKALHSLGVTVIMPRADTRITPAHDYLAMHNNYVMRKRPRETHSPGVTVDSSDAIASPMRHASAFFDPVVDPWESLDVRSNFLDDVLRSVPGHCEISPQTIAASSATLALPGIKGTANEIYMPSPLLTSDEAVDIATQGAYPYGSEDSILPPNISGSGTSSSHETHVSFEDVAAIDLAVESTRDGESGDANGDACGPTTIISNITRPNALSAATALPNQATSCANPGLIQTASTVTGRPLPARASQPAHTAPRAGPLAPPDAHAASSRPPAKRAKRPSGSSVATHGDASGEDARKHVCTQCPSRFKMRGDLQRHVKTVHEGKKSFTCPTCGRTFGHSGHLNRHNESMHLKLRKHACKLCGDKFFQASHLQSHISHVHDRKKPFECHLCRLRLATENGLRNHLRNLHHASESHFCPVPQCGAAFLLATDLARHCAKKHAACGSKTDTNVATVGART